MSEPTSDRVPTLSTEPMNYGFHAHNGWHFKRLDGWVHLTRIEDGEIAEFVIFSPETWGSIVASVSSRGENGASFAAAMNFHMGRSGESSPNTGEGST